MRLPDFRVDGVFYHEAPPDAHAVEAKIDKLPRLADQGTSHPDKRFEIFADDGYVNRVEATIRAPKIESVFQAAKEILKPKGFTHIEVRTIR